MLFLWTHRCEARAWNKWRQEVVRRRQDDTAEGSKEADEDEEAEVEASSKEATPKEAEPDTDTEDVHI